MSGVDPPGRLATPRSVSRRLDADDPLSQYRQRFHIPVQRDGREFVYLAGNSLGLQPRTADAGIREALEAWARLGVVGHFEGANPWFPYHEQFREVAARLVGAVPGEVVMMNSLTVNLHLMMVTFYRPTADRYKILIEDPCFPSDTYAVRSQLECHGYDPANGLVVVSPRPGEHLVRNEDLHAALDREGKRLALVLLGAVNFVTGQQLDLAGLTEAAHRRGCRVGWDLAHAAGNVPLRLHDWNVDFAVWCSYKYLNSGPGAVAGCFVHERHGRNLTLPRFAGWWGNDPGTRFRMQLEREFTARAGADGWQVSNPPIFSLAPVKASLDIFDEAGMGALRERSIRLTGHLESLLQSVGPGWFEIITPTDPRQRGCQLSLAFGDRARDVLKALHELGIVCDFREPNILRAAPTPLYNTFEDVWVFADALAGLRERYSS